MKRKPKRKRPAPKTPYSETPEGKEERRHRAHAASGYPWRISMHGHGEPGWERDWNNIGKRGGGY